MTYIPIKTEINDICPVGTILPFCGVSIPKSWLWCNGQAVSRTTYSDLFVAIQTEFGVGDGASTFNIPDCRGRVIIGAGTAVGLSMRRSGDIGGEETHTLTIPEMASHHHTARNQANSDAGDQGYPKGMGPSGNTDDTGGDQPHNNMQPYLVVSGYIIKY